MLILLVGPKGSGKSHIGRLLEKRLGVHFFHVEPLWMAYYEDCRTAGRAPVIAEGIARIHPAIAHALTQHEHVCVETTGAAAEILHGLLSLAPRPHTRIVRVTAPLELCLERIANRDPAHQIPLDADMIRKVYGLSQSLELESDLVLKNAGLTDSEIIAQVRQAIVFPRAAELSPTGPA